MRANDSGPQRPTDDSQIEVYCMNCGRTFAGRERYQRHNWTDHAGEPDLGEKATGVEA